MENRLFLDQDDSENHPLRTILTPSGWDSDSVSDQSARKTARLLAESITDDPLIKRLVALIHSSSKPHSNTEPWMAIAEQRLAAYQLAKAIGEGQQLFTLREPSSGRDLRVELGIALEIYRARTFLWTDETKRVADAAPVPKHVISHSLLPFKSMFWSWENAYAVGLEKIPIPGQHTLETNWSLLMDQGDFFLVVSDIFNIETRELKLNVEMFRYGQTFPDDFTNKSKQASVKGWLARFSFMNSPYVAPQLHRVQRHIRRDVERWEEKHNKQPQDLTVNVITLRAPDRFEIATRTSDEQNPVEWKHRWWVRGHVRAQWYPSEEAHHLIWIKEHLKGPDDRPFRETIYGVSR